MKTPHQSITAYLNPVLVARNKLDENAVLALAEMRGRMNVLLDRIDANEDPDLDGQMVEEVEQLEYEMQRGWNFDEDPRFHTHWSRPHRCSCRNGTYPNYHPEDGFGAAYRTISGDCPLHAGHTFLAIPTTVRGTDRLDPSRKMLAATSPRGDDA